MKKIISLRPYKESDAEILADIFYNTIHSINKTDYTQEQLDVWAPEQRPDGFWQQRFADKKPFVAEIDGIITGFAEFEPNGHIDCFYVHHEYQGRGVGSALMKAIIEQAERQEIKRIYAEVSITAKPFFEARGFRVIKDQTVIRHGVELKNFVMEKYL